MKPVTLLALCLLLASCASTEERPVTWDDKPTSIGDTGPKRKEKGQAHYDKIASTEFSFMSCSGRARELRESNKDAAVKMLFGCMKRPDFRDVKILRERPFYDAVKTSPEGRLLALNVIGNRDETLRDELDALRLDLSHAETYLENPEDKGRRHFVVKGRVLDTWEEKGRHVIVVMERARTAAGYNRYRTRWRRVGRRYVPTVQKVFVPKNRYRQGSTSEIVDTGLVVVFTVDKKPNVNAKGTYLFLGERTAVRLRGTHELNTTDGGEPPAEEGEPLVDESDGFLVEEEDEEAIGLGEDVSEAPAEGTVKVTPETPLLSLEGRVAL